MGKTHIYSWLLKICHFLLIILRIYMISFPGVGKSQGWRWKQCEEMVLKPTLEMKQEENNVGRWFWEELILIWIPYGPMVLRGKPIGKVDSVTLGSLVLDGENHRIFFKPIGSGRFLKTIYEIWHFKGLFSEPLSFIWIIFPIRNPKHHLDIKTN